VTAPHLSHEALSAALDGAATAAETAHLADCRDCQARMTGLRAVAAAVGAPPPVGAPEVRDAAIGRALAAVGGGRVVPMARYRPALLAAAAVVAILLAAVPILNRDSDRDEFTAVGDRLETSDAAGTAAGGGAAADLGDVTDDEALRLLLAGQLGARSASGPEAAQPAPLAADSALSGDAAVGATAPPRDCTAAAEAAGAGRLGPLLYTAALRYRTVPARVFVFEAPESQQSLPRRAFVMATADCQVLVVLSF
jgi:hypothetical protein